MVILIIKSILLSISAYLLGAVPSAFVFAKIFKGIDITKEGSGNPGISNALDVCGIWPVGILVIIYEHTKVWLCFYLAYYAAGWSFAPGFNLETGGIWNMMLLAGFAFVGHCFSIFLKFKGGKGACIPAGMLIFFGPIYYCLCLFPILIPYVIKNKKHRFKIQNSMLIILMFAASALLILEQYYWKGAGISWRFTRLMDIYLENTIPIGISIAVLTFLFPVKRCINTGVMIDLREGVSMRRAIFLRALFMMYPRESSIRPPGKNFDMVSD